MMNASRRDFNHFAQIVKKVRARIIWLVGHSDFVHDPQSVQLDRTLEILTNLLCEKLWESNPDFDPKKFKAACGYPEDE